MPYRKLGTLISYDRGLVYNKSAVPKVQDVPDSDVYKVLRNANVNAVSSTLDLNDLKCVYRSKVEVSEKCFPHAGDILMAANGSATSKEESNGRAGKVAYIPEDMDGFVYGGFMGVIRVTDVSVLLPRYLYHVLCAKRFKEYIAENTFGTTLSNIRSKVLYAYEVPVPPVSAQRRVIILLDSLAELEAELEAELIQHRTQLSWYRNHLTEIAGGGCPVAD